MNQLGGPVPVDLLAQAVHVDLDKICLAVEVTIPHVFNNFTAGHEFGRSEKQELKECKFPACERDHFFSTIRAAAVAVEFEVAISKSGVAAMETTPHERTDTCEKFGEHKRLCKVIIRSGIETLHFLLDQAAGCKHQDWSFNSPLPKFAADLNTAHTRK